MCCLHEMCAGFKGVPRLELLEADITVPNTLPAAVEGAEYVVCAAGGKGFFSAESVDNVVSGLNLCMGRTDARRMRLSMPFTAPAGHTNAMGCGTSHPPRPLANHG